jgi:hypothetical protein
MTADATRGGILVMTVDDWVVENVIWELKREVSRAGARSLYEYRYPKGLYDWP